MAPQRVNNAANASQPGQDRPTASAPVATAHDDDAMSLSSSTLVYTPRSTSAPQSEHGSGSRPASPDRMEMSSSEPQAQGQDQVCQIRAVMPTRLQSQPQPQGSLSASSPLPFSSLDDDLTDRSSVARAASPQPSTNLFPNRDGVPAWAEDERRNRRHSHYTTDRPFGPGPSEMVDQLSDPLRDGAGPSAEAPRRPPYLPENIGIGNLSDDPYDPPSGYSSPVTGRQNTGQSPLALESYAQGLPHRRAGPPESGPLPDSHPGDRPTFMDVIMEQTPGIRIPGLPSPSTAAAAAAGPAAAASAGASSSSTRDTGLSFGLRDRPEVRYGVIPLSVYWHPPVPPPNPPEHPHGLSGSGNEPGTYEGGSGIPNAQPDPRRAPLYPRRAPLDLPPRVPSMTRQQRLNLWQPIPRPFPRPPSGSTTVHSPGSMGYLNPPGYPAMVPNWVEHVSHADQYRRGRRSFRFPLRNMDWFRDLQGRNYNTNVPAPDPAPTPAPPLPRDPAAEAASDLEAAATELDARYAAVESAEAEQVTVARALRDVEAALANMAQRPPPQWSNPGSSRDRNHEAVLMARTRLQREADTLQLNIDKLRYEAHEAFDRAFRGNSDS